MISLLYAFLLFLPPSAHAQATSDEAIVKNCTTLIEKLRRTVKSKAQTVLQMNASGELPEEFSKEKDKFLKMLLAQGDRIKRYALKNKELNAGIPAYIDGIKERMDVLSRVDVEPIRSFSSYPQSTLSDFTIQMKKTETSNDISIPALDKTVPFHLALVFDPISENISFVILSYNELKKERASLIEMLVTDECKPYLTSADKDAELLLLTTYSDLKKSIESNAERTELTSPTSSAI